MDVIELIRELVSNVGFPIACACMMFYQMEREREAHKEESAAWVEAINRNTSVVEKVLTMMEDAK